MINDDLMIGEWFVFLGLGFWLIKVLYDWFKLFWVSFVTFKTQGLFLELILEHVPTV